MASATPSAFRLPLAYGSVMEPDMSMRNRKALGLLRDRKSTRLNSSHTDKSRMPSFVCNDTATSEISTLSLHDALPICLPLAVGIRVRHGARHVDEKQESAWVVAADLGFVRHASSLQQSGWTASRGGAASGIEAAADVRRARVRRS